MSLPVATSPAEYSRAVAELGRQRRAQSLEAKMRAEEIWRQVGVRQSRAMFNIVKSTTRTRDTFDRGPVVMLRAFPRSI